MDIEHSEKVDGGYHVDPGPGDASAKAQPCFKAVQGATQTYTGMQLLAGCGAVL